MRRFGGIQWRLIFLVGIVLIPLIGLQGYRIQTQYHQRIGAELRASEEIAKAISTSFLNFVDTVWNVQGIIGKTLLMHPEWSENDIESYLISLLGEKSPPSKYSLLRPDGTVLASTQPGLKGMKLQRKFINRIEAGEKQVVSSLVKSPVSGKYVLPIASGIYKEGRLAGIIVSAIDTTRLDDVIPSSKIDAIRKYGLVDSEGKIVFRSGVELTDEQRLVPADSPVWEALKGKLVRTLHRSSHLDGVKRFGVDYPIKEIGWECYVTTSVDEALAPFWADAKRDFYVLLLVGIVSFIAAAVIGRLTLQPVVAIKEAAMQIKRGNLAARTHIQGLDELSSAAELFDQMIDRLQTRLTQAENLLTVGELAASITHEVRNPMTAVRGFIQLLKEQKNEPAADRYFEIILEELDRANQIIGNFLVLARTAENDENTENLNDILLDIQPMICALSNLKGIHTEFRLDESIGQVSVNKNEMKQVIVNLTRNAVEAMDKNGTITIETRREGDEVKLAVSDTGCGIPEEKLSRLFQSFFTTKKEGTGLGLTICKSIVERYNGTISVRSEEGKGTTFTVSLPASSAEKDARG